MADYVGVDMDSWSKARIKVFINSVYADYEDGLDENDLAEILLKFEKYLDEQQERRMRD